MKYKAGFCEYKGIYKGGHSLGTKDGLSWPAVLSQSGRTSYSAILFIFI